MTKRCKTFFESIGVGGLLTCSILLCLIPAGQHWFGWGSPAGQPQVAVWGGLYFLGPAFYLSVILYFFAIFRKAFLRLWLGIFAHILWGISYAIAFYIFPVKVHIAPKADLSISYVAAQPAFWISIAAVGLNFLLFLALEIRDRKANESGGSSKQ